MAKKHPYLRSIALSGLPEFIEKLGGNSTALFTHVGLNPKAISKNDGFISWTSACTLLEHCATSLNEPHFGIKWADDLAEDFPNTGPMIFAAALVPNAGQFLEIAMRYQKTHSNGISNELIVDEDSELVSYIFNFHPKTPPCRQYAEHIIATIIRLKNRVMHNTDFSEIHFQHSRIADLSFYEKKLDCRVIFNSSQFKIVGSSDNLKKPINGPLANTPLNGSLAFFQPFLKTFLDRRVRKIQNSTTPISDLIEEILPAIFGAGKSDIDSVAVAIGLSTKKMQRLLQTEGSNFSSIRDQTRQRITKRIFQESNIPISALALSLDYKSPEAFNTACQRWVGQSPRDYRAALRSENH